jgi:hypothetical protein
MTKHRNWQRNVINIIANMDLYEKHNLITNVLSWKLHDDDPAGSKHIADIE